jgi:hypothetical protein
MKNIILFIISISLLYFILNLNNIDVSQFELLKFETFTVIIICTIFSIFLNTLRLYLISKNILKIRFRDYLYVSFTSFVFNVLSFSGTGELIKYYILSYKLKKKADIFSFFLLERGYGLVSIFVLFTFSISIFFLGLLKSIIILFLIFLILFKLSKNNFYLKKIPYLNYFDYSFFNIYEQVSKTTLLLISLLIHMIYILQLFIIIYFIYKVNIDIKPLIFLTLTVLVLNSIPISYSGFGVREFSVVIVGLFMSLEKLSLINSIVSLGLYTYLFAIIIFVFLYVMLKINYKIDLIRTFFSKKITHVRIK